MNFIFSDQLMSLATRIDGILYLPAYELARELICMSIPVFFAYGLICSLVFDFGRTLYRRIKWAIRRLIRTTMRGVFHV